MSGFTSRLLSFVLALCMAGTLLAGGTVPMAAAQAPAGEAESAGQAEAESGIPAEESPGEGEAAPEPDSDESAPEEAPTAAPEYHFDEIIAAAGRDGAEAAAMVNTLAEEEAFLAALRAVLDYYYGSGEDGGQLAAFAAAVDSRAAQVLAAYAEAAAERQQDREELGYVPGQVVVAFAENVSEPGAEGVLEAQGASLEGTVEVATPEVVAVADISLEQTVEAAVEAIEADPRVEYAQPVYVYYPAEDEEVVVEPEGDFYAAYQAAPASDQRVAVNDSFASTAQQMYFYMWGYEAINTFEAWDLLAPLEGHEKVRVAVLDTAQQHDHPDLATNVRWDLFRDFSAGRISDEQGVFPVPDAKSHGTHVTGIIAATANNARGSFGAAAGYQNNIVEVLPVNVFEVKNKSTGEYGTATIDVIAPAIDYAVAQGAQVINLSLGYQTRSTDRPDNLLSQAVDRAVDAGVTVVAAAGNYNSSSGYSRTDPHYPSDLENVIGVINVSDRPSYDYTTRDGKNVYNADKYDEPRRWDTSNYARGTEKDISAPGARILSTYGPSSYAFSNGTSMAAPMVSAVAAMLLYVRPHLSPAQVREILCGTARDLGDEGYDVQTAWGLVDAEAAVLTALLDPPDGLKTTSAGPGQVDLEWESDLNAVRYTIYRSTALNGNYTQLDTVNTSTYTDLTVQPGVMYYYMVSCSLELDNGQVNGTPCSPVTGMARLATPTDLKAEKAGSTALSVSWGAVEGVDGYYLYRSTQGPGPVEVSANGSPADSTVKRISVSGGSATTYTDRDLDPTQNYYYSVSPWVIRATSATNHSGTTYIGPQAVTESYQRTQLAAPTALRLAASGAEGPTLRWNAATGATGYAVYGGPSPEEMTLLATVPGLTYTDAGLAVNAARHYRVAAVRTPANGPADDRTAEESAPTAALYVFNGNPRPAGLTARSTGYNTVELAWEASADVDGYHLYRATTAAGPYTLAGIREGAAGTTFTDTGLAYNAAYHYRLFHYVVVDGVHREGGQYVQAGPVTTTLATVTDLAVTPGGDGVLQVRWGAVEGASGYHVYRAVGEGDFAAKPYKSLNAKTLSLTDSALAAGPYRYRVEAWRSASGKKLAGPAAEATGTAPGLAAPAGLVASSEADYTAQLRWSPVEEAQGYYIYRGADGEYTLVKTLAGGDQYKWSEANLPAGDYVYRVAAYQTVSRKKTAGAPASAAVTVGGLGAVQNFVATGSLYGATLSWSAPAGDLLGYYVYRSPLAPGAAGFAKSLKLVKTLPASITTYTDSSLAAGDYTYRVAAYSKPGSKKLAGTPVQAVATARGLSPAGLAAASGPRNSARLTWDVPPTAENVLGYYLYRSPLSPGDSGFEKSLKRVKTLKVEALSATGGKYTYEDAPLAAGGYTYRVLPYAKHGGKTMTASATDLAATATVAVAALPAPAGLSGTSPSPYTVALTWQPVEGAGGYQVFRAGGAKAIKTLGADECAFEETGVDPGSAAYEVRAFHKQGGKTFPGLAASITAQVEARAGVARLYAANAYSSLRQGPYNTITLGWYWDSEEMPEDVKGYFIYRQARDEAAMTLIKTLAGKHQGEYRDVGVPEGEYTYYVAPYYRVGSRSLPGRLRAAAGAVSPTPLPAPQQVQAAPATPGYLGATLTWAALRSPADDSLLASGYVVYRSALDEDDPGFENSFAPVKSLSGGTKTTYTETLPSDGRHWYKVAAYHTVGKQKVEGTPSEAVYLDPVSPSGVTLDGFTAAPEGYHAARLTWTPVRDAEHGNPAGYYIYRSATAGGTYTLAATVNKGATGTVKITGLEAGAQYFMITPYFKAGKVTLTGASTGPRAVAVAGLDAFAAAPTATAGWHSVKLSWQPVEGATSYQVWLRAEADAGDEAAWALAGTAKKSSKPAFTVSPLEKGRYDFKVVACHKAGKLTFGSSAAQTAAPTEVEHVSATGALEVKSLAPCGVELGWAPADGASGYNIYRSSGTPTDLDFEDSFTLAGSVAASKTAYKDYPPAAGDYWYKVVPYRTVSRRKMEGKGPAPQPGTCQGLGGLAAPAATATDVKGKTTVTLAWQPVEGAAGYTLYESDTPNGPGLAIATKKGNGATAHTLKNVQGTEHYYYVRAWYKGGKVTYYGPPSPRTHPWD